MNMPWLRLEKAVSLAAAQGLFRSDEVYERSLVVAALERLSLKTPRGYGEPRFSGAMKCSVGPLRGT